MEFSISSTRGFGFGLLVTVLMGLPHHIAWRLHSYYEGRGGVDHSGRLSSFDLDNLPGRPHGKDEKNLIGLSRPGKALARNDVKEESLAVLEGIPADEGHIVVPGAL